MDAFFDQYEDLVNQMASVFPEDSDWARYRTGLAVFRRTNPMMVVKKTWEYVSPYKEVIQARDDNFFLANDVSEGYLIDTVEKLRGMWGQLTPHNRSIVWDYITNITYLAKKCVD